MEPRRLYKSTTDKAIFGVCGGFAEYFGIDSLIIRLVLVLFTLAFGAGLLFYLIAALIMPKRPEDGGTPVQPAQPGAYNAGGATYVNRASSAQDAYTPYTAPAAEAMPREVARSAAPAAEEKPAEAADPVSRTWAMERKTQEMRGAAAGAPKQEAKPQEAKPQEPKAEPVREVPRQEIPKQERAYQAYQQPQRTQSAPRSSGDKTRLLLGAILLLIGGFMLVHIFLPRFDTRILFAVCAIVAGAVLILKRD